MLKKIMQIDRRIIFILVALAVIIPTLLKVSFPITVSEPTRKLYDYIEDLPPGSTVLIAFDYGPSSMAAPTDGHGLLTTLFSEKNPSHWNDPGNRRSYTGL